MKFQLNLFFSWLSFTYASTPLLDLTGSNSLLQRLPKDTTCSSIITIITSPNTPSPCLVEDTSESSTLENCSLILRSNGDTKIHQLSCRGATRDVASRGDRLAWGVSSLVSQELLLEGITTGDIQDFRQSRHARTLTALFRTALQLGSTSTDAKSKNNNTKRQGLWLGILTDEDVDSMKDHLTNEVHSIYNAVAVEIGTSPVPKFQNLYDLQIVALETREDAESILAKAEDSALTSIQEESDASEDVTLATLLMDAHTKLVESGIHSEALDSPIVARAFVSCRQAYAKQAKSVRVQVAAFQSRTSRGLLVDQWGTLAESLRTKALNGFDMDTLYCAGLTKVVSQYRLELRTQLQALIEASLEDSFVAQVQNLERSVIKKLKRQLLKKQTDSSESNIAESAAAMRNAVFAVESALDTLQAPTLGLTKERVLRDLTNTITDVVSKFPDSPEAQLKRLKAVTGTTSKKKKPKERALDLGIDLVAMIRPDGFGSLQGYAGYQLGGNSITVGVANDADDPQVIAQMGGVRPPLIRIQPKLRVDVEL